MKLTYSAYPRIGPAIRLALILAVSSSGFTSPLNAADQTPYYRWTTLAGRAKTGYDDGLANDARFNDPHGLATDAAGNLYVADTGNHTIRKFSVAGIVTTLAGSPNQAGSADGTGAAARFFFPQGVTADANGNVYVADTGNHTIRKITPEGVVTTLAGQAGQRGTENGPASTAKFSSPTTLFADNQGRVYVIGDSIIRRIPTSGDVNTIELGGTFTTPTGQQATITSISRIAISPDGEIYFSANTTQQNGNTTLRTRRLFKRDLTGALSLLASSHEPDGRPYLSESVTEVAMTTDRSGNVYYVTELISSAIVHDLFKIGANGEMERQPLGGASRPSDGNRPRGLAIDSSGNVFHTNTRDDVIFKTAGTTTSIVAGTPWSNLGANGTSSNARFAAISSLTFAPSGALLVGDAYSRHNVHNVGGARVRVVSSTGETSTLYDGPALEAPPETSTGIVAFPSGDIVLASLYGTSRFTQITPGGNASRLPSTDVWANRGMEADSSGQLITAGFTSIYRRATDGTWSLIAGNQRQPYDIIDGNGGNAQFASILSLAVATNGDAYVLDTQTTGVGINRVALRKVLPNGNVITIKENLTKTTDIRPEKLSIDAKGDFILSYNDDTVRLLTAAGTEFIIGGSSDQSGARDGDGQTAQFYQPGAITSDAQNNLYVADNLSVTIRKGEFLGYSALISSHPQSISVNVGATAQFSVTASGTPAPNYQWQFNGSAIAGATGSTLSLPNVTTANAGNYTVFVSNPHGSVTSNAATLTVNTPTTPNPPTTPNSPATGGESNSSGGGGGSPSLWFIAALFGAGALRLRNRLSRS